MLMWIYHINPAHPPWESWEKPENTFFTMIVRNRFGRGAPASLTISMVALLCRLEVLGGAAITKLGSLNAM